DDLYAQNHTFQGLAQFHSDMGSVSGSIEPRRLRVAAVSREFFSIMGVQPVRGRSFVPEEQQVGAATAVLVSYSYWQQYLNGASDLSLFKLKVEDKPASVIGVLAPGFHFPEDSDVWMARELYPRIPSRTGHNSNVIG